MKKIIILIVLGVLMTISSNSQNNIIPIEYDGHIYLQGNIKGINGNFVFDTGALSLYIDTTYYANNNLKYRNIITAMLPGAGTTPQKTILVRDTVCFNFGEYSYSTPDVAVFQLKPILGDYSDGIIGIKYFSQSVMEINYIDKYIKLHKKVNPEDVADYQKIKMNKRNGKLFIPISVQINENLTIKEDILLDIGSGGSVSITSAMAKKYTLDKEISQKSLFFTKYGGIGGESSSFSFKAKSVQLGNYQLDGVLMDYSEDKSGALASDKHLGLLGNNILDRFNLIIDFINNDLYLKPNKNISVPYEFSRLGFSFVDRSQTKNAWIVSGLYKNGNAQNAGLKIDDKIIEVNGTSVHDIKFGQQKEFFKNFDEADLTIIRNNETKKIRFKLKPIQ